jgi:tetratricopeptide (TPR) repeat protein
MTVPTPRTRPPWSGLDWVFLFTTCVVTLAIYFQTRTFDFINYDDHLYVYENRHVLHGLSLDSLGWATTAIVAANWHPLTLYTELVLSSVFGPKPGTFHLANTFLHVINAGLVFAFLRYATGRAWPAFFTAILWAWHPLRVESVAWVSELKDVLCGFFFLCCLIAYVRYSRRRTLPGYFGVLALHAAALLSKPMAVTLPAVLILLDYWPLDWPLTDGFHPRASGWWTRRILEKLPLLALSIGDIAYAFSTQIDTGSVGDPRFFPLPLRLRNAVVSVVFYLRDTVVPVRLGLFYPHPAMIGGTVTWTAAAAALLVLLAITAVVVWRRQQPYLLVGWLWFLGMLTPVIGLVQIGEQARADRYTYLPAIGLTFAIVWAVADWSLRRAPLKSAAVLAGAAAAIALGVVSYGDVSYWHDSGTLFGRGIRINPNNYLALMIQADRIRTGGDPARALPIAADAFRIAPDSLGGQITYGLALRDTKHLDQAAEVLQRAIAKNNHSAQAWDALGDIRDAQANAIADAQFGDFRANARFPIEMDFRSRALVNYRQATLADSEYYVGRYHLAYEQSLTGQLDKAIAGWEQLLADYPDLGVAHGNLADAYHVRNKIEAAIQQYAAAYQCGERNPEWEYNLGWLTATSLAFTPQQAASVLPAAEDAVARDGGKNPLHLDGLAAVEARVGDFNAAVTNASAARDLALAAGKPRLADQIASRIRLYEQGKAYIFGEKQ